MILRLVKMQFKDDEIASFKTVFENVRSKISEMPGCVSVDLKQDLQHKNVFFTLSYWRNNNDLELYRQSDLFIKTWRIVKPMFLKKAEAWTLNA